MDEIAIDDERYPALMREIAQALLLSLVAEGVSHDIAVRAASAAVERVRRSELTGERRYLAMGKRFDREQRNRQWYAEHLAGADIASIARRHRAGRTTVYKAIQEQRARARQAQE